MIERLRLASQPVRMLSGRMTHRSEREVDAGPESRLGREMEMMGQPGLGALQSFVLRVGGDRWDCGRHRVFRPAPFRS